MASRALGRATLPPQQHRRFRSAHSFGHSVIACAARLPLAWQSARMPCAVLGYMRCAQVVQLRCRCVYHSGCLKSDRTNQPFLRCERVRGGYEFRVLTGYSVVLTAYGVGMGLGMVSMYPCDVHRHFFNCFKTMLVLIRQYRPLSIERAVVYSFLYSEYCARAQPPPALSAQTSPDADAALRPCPHASAVHVALHGCRTG